MLARRFGLFPFRSPLLWESHVVFFSSPYLDVSVQAVPLHTLWIGVWMTEVCSAGFPHSDISGSLDICSSPKLFAAYHVFHRLLVPRHPPCALSSLTNFYILHSVAGVGSGCLCSQTVHLSMLLFLLGCLVSIFCVRYLCILLYAIFKVQKFDKVCFRFRWALKHFVLRSRICSAYPPSVPSIRLLTSKLDASCCMSQTPAALRPYQLEMEGFEPLTPCLQGRCSPN